MCSQKFNEYLDKSEATSLHGSLKIHNRIICHLIKFLSLSDSIHMYAKSICWIFNDILLLMSFWLWPCKLANLQQLCIYCTCFRHSSATWLFPNGFTFLLLFLLLSHSLDRTQLCSRIHHHHHPHRLQKKVPVE